MSKKFICCSSVLLEYSLVDVDLRIKKSHFYNYNSQLEAHISPVDLFIFLYAKSNI